SRPHPRSTPFPYTTLFRSLIPAIRKALSNNAHDYLNPPIRNIGNKGIVKMSKEILKWPSRSNNFEHDLCLTALLMERAGTGGARSEEHTSELQSRENIVCR